MLGSKRDRYKETNKFFAYSNDASRPFWNAVNDLKNDADKQEIYSLGVALQNFESYVLRQLQNKIDDEKAKNGK